MAEKRMAMRMPVESGDPRIEKDGFRRSLAEFATGVTVITTSVGDERFGLTSNSFRLGVARAATGPVVDTPRKQELRGLRQLLALHREHSRRRPDRTVAALCAVGTRQVWGTRLPCRGGGYALFAGVAATFECACNQTFDGGDHLVLVGEVVRYSRYDRQPLLFVKGRYAVSADHPDTRVFTAAAKDRVSLKTATSVCCPT